MGIAAGLYASVKGGSAIQVMVLAECYAFGLMLGMLAYHAVLGLFLRSSVGGALGWLFSLAMWIAMDLALFLALIRISVRRLQLTWQEETAAPEQPGWVEVFSDSDFWRTAFRWDKRRTLDLNPIAWLQEYSWTARLTKWGWFLGTLLVEVILVSNWDKRKSMGWQPLLAAMLGAGVAFSAAGSFRRERQAGLLELLLVTPLSANRLIQGRLWGIFCHYSPALAVLVGGWMGDRGLNPRVYTAGYADFLCVNPLTFVSVSVLGLLLSLSRLNVLVAWLLTWVIGYLIPVVISFLLVKSGYPFPKVAFTAHCVLQVALCAGAWWWLLRNLRRRTFLRADSSGQA
jgi:hypothetical protein